MVLSFIRFLGDVALNSLTGMFAVVALFAAPPLAALLIKPWRHLAFRVAIVATVLWAVSVAVNVRPVGRLMWTDSVFFGIIFGLLPIAFAWLLGLVVLGTLRWPTH
jgi:hypothetical protein